MSVSLTQTSPQERLPQLCLPLIRHYAPETALAWVDQAVSPRQFVQLARKLARSPCRNAGFT